jgi:surface antigen
VRAGAALVVATCVLAGCGGGGAGTPTPGSTRPPARQTPEPPSDEQLLDELLRDRADALQDGDRHAFLMTATRARRRVDRTGIAAAAALPLRAVDLEAGGMSVIGRRARAEVTVRYRIEGVRGTFQSTRLFAFVKRGGRWRVATVRGGRGRPPWEVGRFAVRRTRHFVVLAPPRAAAGDLTAALENGYREMRSRLQLGRLRRRYLVIATADPDQTRALTSEIRGLASLVAISDATINERGRARAVSAVVSLRLLVVHSAFAGLDAEGKRRTIAHELTHAALAGATSGRTPAWLVEGVAMYVSGDRRVTPPGADLRPLSRPEAIAKLSGPAQARAYAASSAAAFAIVDRFGAKKLLALYDAFNDPKLRGLGGPRLTDRALRRELGIRLADVL